MYTHAYIDGKRRKSHTLVVFQFITYEMNSESVNSDHTKFMLFLFLTTLCSYYSTKLVIPFTALLNYAYRHSLFYYWNVYVRTDTRYIYDIYVCNKVSHDEGFVKKK